MNGAVVIDITRIEAAHLLDLVEQFVELLGDSRGAGDDPAVRRLVPDAYDDPAAAQEFRDLVEGDLLDRRRSDAAAVAATLTPASGIADDAEEPALLEAVTIRLDAGQAQAWLRTLAAIRLVLATRLGIADDDDHDPEDRRFGIYDWLGFRLDGLVHAMDGD